MASSEVKVPFFKKKARPTTGRKRSNSPTAVTNSSNPSSSKSEVVLPSKKGATNLLSAGTKRKASERERDEYDADPEAPEKDGPDVKWTSAGSHINAAMEILAGDELEELMAKKRIKEKGTGDSDDEGPDDGKYRGQGAYKSHLKKNKEVPKAMRVGPQRSNNSTIRTVTIVDYQPDVCKDYKETGYCGFGDTCKFLHDRGTYLAGWQLDKLAENSKNQAGGDDTDDSDSDDEDIPFACLICRKHYTDPIVTRCGHYFCSACAIKRFSKTPKCAACGAPTGGMFNRADKVLEKVQKKRKEKEEGDGDDDGDETGNVEIEGLSAEKAGASENEDEDSDEDD
ncbi:RNA-splicing factor [Marasmius tenuissimus]|uniref:Pre-mRNA-splicing factor CWC24 n=1 Tax=Marasmius tenuissimus TaxID=585030 RepID=A0ABR3A0H6_9AGAR